MLNFYYLILQYTCRYRPNLRKHVRGVRGFEFQYEKARVFKNVRIDPPCVHF